MFDGRKRIVAALTAPLLLAATAVGIGVFTGPAHAEPNIDTVQKKVDTLYAQAEVASECYNAAKTRLKTSQTTLDALNADLDRQQAVVDTLKKQVAQAVVAQYQGQSLSTAGQMVLSGSPDSFLENLNAISSYNDQRGELMARYNTESKRLSMRKHAVSTEVASLTRTEDSLAKDKATADTKAAEAKKVLDQLKAKQRAEVLSGNYTGPLPTDSGTGRAAAAIRYAMAQVGKAYVFGAAGPGAFDCSGLTMRAWGAAGVGLPHSSSAQYGMGPHIPESQLKPGDLVFYYSPIHHVGMYIGNGLIVNAENPSVGVKVTGLHSMPYVGAVRPG